MPVIVQMEGHTGVTAIRTAQRGSRSAACQYAATAATLAAEPMINCRSGVHYP